MSLWTAIVVIALAGMAAETYRSSLRTRARVAESDWSKFLDRFEALERRVENLETLLLDREKEKKFDALGG